MMLKHYKGMVFYSIYPLAQCEEKTLDILQMLRHHTLKLGLHVDPSHGMKH